MASNVRRGQLELGYLAVLAGRAVQAATEAASPRLDMPAADANALYELCQHGALTAGSIAQLLNIHQSAVTLIADRLEARGLVARRRDETDRRRVWLVPTVAGRVWRDHAAEHVDEHVASVFTPLGPGASAALAALLEDVVLPWLSDRLVPAAAQTPITLPEQGDGSDGGRRP